MSHSVHLVGRHIDIARVGAAGIRRHESHVDSFLDRREQQAVLSNPAQSRRIRHEGFRLARAKDRYLEGIPGEGPLNLGEIHACPIWRKTERLLPEWSLGELDGIAIGKRHKPDLPAI